MNLASLRIDNGADKSRPPRVGRRQRHASFLAKAGGVLSGTLLVGWVAWGAQGAVIGPQPTFDAVQFRAEERGPLAQPTFDAVQFRAEERSELVQPTFDAVQFRAEERSELGK